MLCLPVFRKFVNHASLSRANESRDYRIFEGLGLYLIDTVRPMYSNIQLSQITIDNVIYALDSTTISTRVKLATWVLGKYSKGAVKMHTLLDLRGSIPPISISRTASGMTATNLMHWHRSLMLSTWWIRPMLTLKHFSHFIRLRHSGYHVQKRTWNSILSLDHYFVVSPPMVANNTNCRLSA